LQLLINKQEHLFEFDAAIDLRAGEILDESKTITADHFLINLFRRFI